MTKGRGKAISKFQVILEEKGATLGMVGIGIDIVFQESSWGEKSRSEPPKILVTG